MTDRDEQPEGEPAAPADPTPFTAAELAALGPSDGTRDGTPGTPDGPRPYGAGTANPRHSGDQQPTAPLQLPRHAGYGAAEPGDHRFVTPPHRSSPYGTGELPTYGSGAPAGAGRPAAEPPRPPYGGSGPSRPAGQYPGGTGDPQGDGRPPFQPGPQAHRSAPPYNAPPGQPPRPQHTTGAQPQSPAGRAPYPGGAPDRPAWNPPGGGYPPAPPQRPGTGPAPVPFPADPFGPQPKQKRRVPAVALVAAVVVTALVCGALGGVAGGIVQAQRAEPTASGSPAVAAGSIGAVVKQVLPSVVSVIVPQSDGSEFVGAGSIISADGYIMTNEHVVSTTEDNGGKVKVELNTGEEVDATVKGMSATADIAVLKIDRTGLRPITWGDSRKVQVGDRVIAVGNPLGLAETTTSGIVSALNRPVHVNQHSNSYYAAIQTDAAINPGNSGGPLFDINGKLIGVNYAGAARQNVGLGFAIPARSAQRTAQQLIKTGKATHAVIGVYTDGSYRGDGAKIAESEVDGKEPVAEGGPADKAGMQPGDVITKINGIPIHSGAALTAVIRTQAPGDVVTAVYERSGSPTTTKMTLGEESDK